nr:hypothetical protein [Paucibacter sp. M5-1]MCZ7883745.1 hypothetical protein [Paucibacter sp. M5-1]
MLRADGSVLLLGRSTLLDRTPGTALAGSTARVISGIAASSIAAGRLSSLALGRDGLLYGWGVSSGGTLGGDAINANVDAPRVMAGVDGVVAGLPVSNYSLALRNDGTVWHWPGVLRYAPESVAPRQIAGFSGVRKLVAGMTGGVDSKQAPLAIKSDGTVWRLSWSTATVMGTGGPEQVHSGSAEQLAGLADVVDVSCTQHCLALLGNGRVMAWGRNVEGQLGKGSSGDLVPVTVPALVPGLEGLRAIGASRNASVAVGSDGRIWAWGGNAYSGLGSGGPVTAPTLLAGLAAAVDVSCDDGLCLLRLGDGTVWGWGGNGNGELGDGSTLERLTPVQASGLSLN